MANQDILTILEQRLGRRHARQRLGIEKDHEAQVFGQGINFFHIENLALSPVLIRAVLMATGLYWRGVSNAAKVDIRHGFDTLTLVGRSLFAVCRRLSHSGRVVPGVMSRSTEAAEGGTRDEVSLDVEDVVNGGVDGDEALG